MSASSTSDEAEEWRSVVGWEGLYEVSSLGRVRSLDRVVSKVSRHGGLVQQRLKGKLLVQPSNPGGYLQIGLSDMTRGRGKITVAVHILACTAFVGEQPEGMQVGHLDGNQKNNRADNLAWVTPAENQAHRLLHGTSNRGQANYNLKLTAADVAEIRRLRGAVLQSELAARFGVSFQHISAVQLRKFRQHD